MRLASALRYRAINFTLGLALLLAAVPTAFAETTDEADASIKFAQGLSTAFEKAASVITPSVVSVSSMKKASSPHGMTPNDPMFEQFRNFFGDDFFDRFGGQPNQPHEGFAQQGLGTGVVVDVQGHILTNNHVVAEADELNVKLQDGRTFKAELVGTDPKSDLAVIKIKAEKLSPAQLGDSDQLRIGEWVVAAGNPFGLENSITAGIVSAKGRSLVGGGQFEDFIQTDAAINPGNSGGPLINLRGEVIGINTAIFSKSGGYMGIGFAIPANMAKSVMASLITSGKVVRGWLGVGIQNLTEDLSQSFNYPGTDGALIGHIEPVGPADKSGIKQGDIVVGVNGGKIKNTNEFRNIVASTAPGKELDLEIVRDGRKQGLKVKIGEMPSQQMSKNTPDEAATDIGVAVETLTPQLAQRLGAKTTSGVIVTGIRPGSISGQSGLQLRDIIVNINGTPIATVKEFKALATKAALAKGLRLVVETQGMERYIFLKAD